MRVRMIAQVSGSRNGQPWPEPGVEVDLPDVEARAAIRSGVAVDPSKDTGEKVLVPPAGVHVPGRTGYGDVDLVEVPASAVADPKAAVEARQAVLRGDSAKRVPAGTGVQNRDGSAMSAEQVDEALAEDEQAAKDFELPSPAQKAPASSGAKAATVKAADAKTSDTKSTDGKTK